MSDERVRDMATAACRLSHLCISVLAVSRPYAKEFGLAGGGNGRYAAVHEAVAD